jgi:PAS domain-containing protein
MTALAPRPLALPPLLATFLEALPDAVVVADDGGRIMAVNALAASLFGYRVDELLAQPIECLLPPDLAGHDVALHHADGPASNLRGPRARRWRGRPRRSPPSIPMRRRIWLRLLTAPCSATLRGATTRLSTCWMICVGWTEA